MVEEKNFAELVDESMNVPEKGKIFIATVVRVDKDDVFLDFGSKSEGVAAVQEFYNKEGELAVDVGEEVEVVIDSWINEGLPRLSKTKAGLIKENEILKNAYEKGELVTATVQRKVKGGLIADVGKTIEIRAFIPGSQIDIRPQADLDKFIGQTIETRIIKLADSDVVLSRRAILEEEREVQRKETLSKLEQGTTVSGKVVNIINQGVFVDLGGIEGFIPISELSWGRIAHPSNVVSIDEDITVGILKIENNERITLSLKETTSDPWEKVRDKYTPGTQITGKAVSLTDFGVFVELEPGVEGLVHVSEIAWTKRFKHPKEVVEQGSTLQTVILDVNSENRRISLSLKQIEQSPWQLFKEDNPEGSKIKGTIRNVTDKGIFVEVAENIVGLVRPDSISWEGRVNPEESYEKGKEIEVVVLNVDEKNQRIGLGVKQLSSDPWEEALKKYKPRKTSVTGKVKDVKEWGIVLELEDKLEGYIRANEYSDEKGSGDITKNVKEGDEITALVTGLDKRKRQINLSKKKYEQWREKQSVSDFMSSQGEASVKLGDLLGSKLKSISNDEVG
jgi:small subunit ribosomal protein S1